VPAALAADKAAAEKKVADLKAANAPLADAGRREGAGRLPKTRPRPSGLDQGQGGRPRTAAKPLAGMPPHAASSRATRTATRRPSDLRRFARNFLALVFCLMVGTAALPHILMRYYTTPSVKEARESVTWSLFFIFLLYFTAPALAVLVKYEVYNNVLVGTPFDSLPAWVVNWARSTRPAVGGPTSTRTASCSWPRCASAATSSCWPRRRSPACPT
jgi:cation/acetate symporter